METLADRIARDGPIKELDAVGWAIRLAKRLEALHTLGVAHGSVSTACIVTDGVERTARAHLADVQHTTAMPSFHSPERIMGGDISTADDTWAVAVTLYTALTGTNPFGAPRDSELRHRILAASPTPLAVFDVGDDDLQHILDRAFARELNRRATTVASLRHALEDWHPDPGVGELPPLDDGEEEDDDGDDGVRTMMRAAPMFFDRKPAPKHAPLPVPDDDDDDDEARTMMREPGMVPGPSPAAPPASPFGNSSDGFRPLAGGRNVAPARPAAGRPADLHAPPISGRMPTAHNVPPPALVNPPVDDDDDDDDVRTRMRSPTIDDEDSSDVRTKMRDPGMWPGLAGLGRAPAPPPAAGAAPISGNQPIAPVMAYPSARAANPPGDWGTPENPGSPKTMALDGFDLPPMDPPEAERPGPALNLFGAPKGPQLGPIGGGRPPMESGSYGRPPLDAHGAPMGSFGMPPALPPPDAYAALQGGPSGQFAPFPAPPAMPLMNAPRAPSSGRLGVILAAIFALFVAAILTFIVLRYRAILFSG